MQVHTRQALASAFPFSVFCVMLEPINLVPEFLIHLIVDFVMLERIKLALE